MPPPRKTVSDIFWAHVLAPPEPEATDVTAVDPRAPSDAVDESGAGGEGAA